MELDDKVKLTGQRFFVTGMGRSGTKWLAVTLRGTPDVRVQHEAFWKYDNAHWRKIADGRMNPGSYIDGRIDLMAEWAARQSVNAFGDVNSYLRYCARELRESFGVPVAGLIRDGHRTVRSLMRRGMFINDENPGLEPPADVRGNRFASCCWYWVDAYRRLIADDVPIYTLESLNESYLHFSDLTSFLGITVPEEHWTRWSNKPVGASPKPFVPLSDGEVSTFNSVAGDIHARFYSP